MQNNVSVKLSWTKLSSGDYTSGPYALLTKGHGHYELVFTLAGDAGSVEQLGKRGSLKVLQARAEKHYADLVAAIGEANCGLGERPDICHNSPVKSKKKGKAKKEHKTEKAPEAPKPVKVSDNELEWNKEPEGPKDSGSAKVYYWNSACQRYRVSRFESASADKTYFGAEYKRDDGTWDTIDHESTMGRGYPKHYSSLRGALNCLEAFHCERTKVEGVSSNAEEVFAAADKLQLSGVKKVEKNPERKPGDKKPRAAASSDNDTAPKTRGKRGGRPELFGYSVSPLSQFLAIAGWELKEVVALFAKVGVNDIKEVTIRTAMTDSKNPKYRKPAEVTAEHAAEFEKLRNG